MQLNINAAIRFYDEVSSINSKHASSITGLIGEDIALNVFRHYARSQDWDVTVLDAPCTEGKRKGKWLDKWLVVARDSPPCLYQVEIKNWSAHSLGGKHLAHNSSPEEIALYKQQRWRGLWDQANERFYGDYLNKVLSPMQPPLAQAHLPVEPLLILWFAIHPFGLNEPFFTMKAQGAFARVHVFSVSAYLRALNVDTIQLDVPRIEERMYILQTLLPQEFPASPFGASTEKTDA